MLHETFYFNVNLIYINSEFLSKHGETKVQGPEVVIQMPLCHTVPF